MYKRGLVVLMLVTLLPACAGNRNNKPEMNEVFVTDIQPDGKKQFSYSVTVTMPQQRRGGMNGGMPGAPGGGPGGMGGGMGGMGGSPGGMRGGMPGSSGRPDREEMMTRMQERVYADMEAKLAETGYCHAGYEVLDSDFGREQMQIRGACKDKATAEDLDKFARDKDKDA